MKLIVGTSIAMAGRGVKKTVAAVRDWMAARGYAASLEENDGQSGVRFRGICWRAQEGFVPMENAVGYTEEDTIYVNSYACGLYIVLGDDVDPSAIAADFLAMFGKKTGERQLRVCLTPEEQMVPVHLPTLPDGWSKTEVFTPSAPHIYGKRTNIRAIVREAAALRGLTVEVQPSLVGVVYRTRTNHMVRMTMDYAGGWRSPEMGVFYPEDIGVMYEYAGVNFRDQVHFLHADRSRADCIEAYMAEFFRRFDILRARLEAAADTVTPLATPDAFWEI